MNPAGGEWAPVEEARRDLGVRVIALYKGTKAVTELLLACALVALAAGGELAALQDLAAHLQAGVASRWSLALGRLLATLASREGAHLLELGLALDAALSAVEGWSLWRGYRWGPWLVVAATAAPLPLEAIEIARAHHAWRIAIALVNLAVVGYLALRIVRRAARPAP